MKPHYEDYEFKYPTELTTRFNPAYPQFGEEKVMSNKFLPFITDTTNPESIFKAIVQRSKGIPSRDLVVIYSAIVHLGVSKIKLFVETLNPTISANDVFNAIASNYRQYEIPVQDLTFWECVILNYGQLKIKNSPNYSLKELSIMITCLANSDHKKLKDVGFDQNIDLLSQYSDQNFDWNVADLSNIKFTPEGQKIGFTCFTEFKAFIAYYQQNPNDLINQIYPVYISQTSENVNELDYATKFCISPYKVYTVPDKQEIPEEADNDDIPF